MAPDSEYYQSHKDDEDVWGDPVPPERVRSESRRLASMISVRLSPEEAELLRAVAADCGQSLSGFIRAAALQAAAAPIPDLRGGAATFGRSSTEIAPTQDAPVVFVTVPEQTRTVKL